MHSDKPLLATSITAMAKKKPLQGTGSRDFLFFLAYACKIADSRTLMGHFPTLNFESNGYGFESKWSPRRICGSGSANIMNADPKQCLKLCRKPVLCRNCFKACSVSGLSCFLLFKKWRHLACRNVRKLQQFLT